MARKSAPDGVSDTLVRLIGHADQRPLLTKYAKTEVFKNHLQDGDEIRFKRSKECDNLICNVLALDQIFGSQDWVVKLVSGSASKGCVRERIKRSREQMDAKFKAYGYWLHRMDSLNSVLDEEFDFKSSSLEDVLTASSSFTPISSTSSPYALRAVQLLETIEEDGRQSKLGVQQQSEKAWALYRLGLYEQAVDIAEEVVQADPSCSECWMLLATHVLYQKHEASKSVFKYMQQREHAEALSAHERWAEEMAEEAWYRQFEALKREREIMFSALMYWPEDDSDSREKYKNPGARRAVLNACINWLFHLLNVYTLDLGSIDSSKLYALNGLSPEYEFRYGNAHFRQSMANRNLPGHSLSELEVKAAELIFEELDGSEEFRGYINLRLLMPDLVMPDLMMSFKLLHIRFVLDLPGYEDHRDEFISQFVISGESEISDLVRSPVLFSILFVHLAKGKLIGDLERINEIISAIELEQKNKKEFLALNLYRKSYDYFFVRGLYEECIHIAEKALVEENFSGNASPEDMVTSLSEGEWNYMTKEFWQYLRILAALKCSDGDVKNTLLSIEHPSDYFSDQKKYMVNNEDEFEEWLEEPYRESIISDGHWMHAVESLLVKGSLSDDEKEKSLTIVSELKDLLSPENKR